MPEVEPQPEALRRTAAIGRDELAASETTPDRPAIGLHLDPLTTSVLVASPSSPTSSDAMISLASASALPPRPLPVASPSPDLLPAPPAADADGVRPMTMAPPASTDPGPGITIGGPLGGGTTNRILCDPYGNCTSDNPSGGGSGGSGGGDSGGSGGGDSGGSGGSGGGDPPPDDIEIDISGGWVHGYQDRVPVGAIVSFGFDTSQINGEIESVSWDGGTDVRSYFSDPGGAPAPKGFHVTTGVPKDQSGYSFIVDADARQYTIFVTVTLVDGRSDSDELTFTSVRPDVQLTHSIASQPRVVPQSPLPGTVSIKLDNPGGGNWPNNAGAKIDASTTTKEFPGSFMFMQLIRTQRFALNQNGIQISMPVQEPGRRSTTVSPATRASSPIQSTTRSNMTASPARPSNGD